MVGRDHHGCLPSAKISVRGSSVPSHSSSRHQGQIQERRRKGGGQRQPTPPPAHPGGPLLPLLTARGRRRTPSWRVPGALLRGRCRHQNRRPLWSRSSVLTAHAGRLLCSATPTNGPSIAGAQRGKKLAAAAAMYRTASRNSSCREGHRQGTSCESCRQMCSRKVDIETFFRARI